MEPVQFFLNILYYKQVVDFLKSVLYIEDDPKTCVRFSIPCFRPNLFYDVVQDNTNGVSVPHLKIFIDKYLTEENVSLEVSILFLQ